MIDRDGYLVVARPQFGELYIVNVCTTAEIADSWVKHHIENSHCPLGVSCSAVPFNYCNQLAPLTDTN